MVFKPNAGACTVVFVDLSLCLYQPVLSVFKSNLKTCAGVCIHKYRSLFVQKRLTERNRCCPLASVLFFFQSEGIKVH